MNNQQFRRLVLESSGGDGRSGGTSAAASSTSPRGGATPALGSRLRASIPMTPRAVATGGTGVDFARQLREQNGPTAKKFKSSAAPKGSKLAAGYTDRARALREQDEDFADDKERRVKALEEQLKLGQIEQGLFETLRDEIIGGDVEHVHLVKGLDWKLLERVRRGEDVLSEKNQDAPAEEVPKDEAEIDREFDEVESKGVKPLTKDERSHVRDMPPPPVAGKKRTRDEILRELKASRAAKAAEAQPSLSNRFRKIGAKDLQPGTSRIERDEKGREVLIVVDAHGNVKRKVRKAKPEAEENASGLLMPDKAQKPLGMNVPDAPTKPNLEEEEVGDIFADAGSDYDPMDGMNDEEPSDSSDDDEGEAAAETTKGDRTVSPVGRARREPSPKRRSPIPSISSSPRTGSSPRSRSRSPPPQAPAQPPNPSAAPRNYFGAGSKAESTPAAGGPSNPLNDPSMIAALKRAAGIAHTDPSHGTSATEREAAAARQARHKAMLANVDRDADDMDLGFGESRLGDEEDEGRVRLAEWGADDKSGEWKGRGGQKQRKRGKKKKEGDSNSAKDVLGVLARRKG